MERVAALDLLRGTAALSVAVPHFIMLNSAAGWAETVSVLAVEVFFVLSGFVLGPQILRCLHSGQAGDLGIFLARRWMRTIPPYLFALALISTIVGHVELADLARYRFMSRTCSRNTTSTTTSRSHGACRSRNGSTSPFPACS
jgi:peptidoglycan/LPS O-acetylase OafA/YrhL